jgi:putative ABC transport system permease protein
MALGADGRYVMATVMREAGVLLVAGLTLGTVRALGDARMARSMLSYSAAQRTREIGLRMALGAKQIDVLKLVLYQGIVLMLTGIGTGLAGGLALTRVTSSLLYGVRPTDPLTFVCVSLLLGGAVLFASYVPARRAMKVDPMVALRYE